MTEYNKSSEAYTVSEAAYESTQTSCATANTTYNTATESRKKQESTANSLASGLDSALSTYNSQSKTYDNTVASQASSVASAVNSQKNARLSASTDNEEKQVEQYQEQLAEGDLLAPIGGIVTAVNVEQGDTYNQGTVVTIQDNSSYEVEAQIGEYDISDIEVGQKVLIKTEATRDEELEGTIIFVSPTASQTAGSSGVTYTVRISVDTPNDRLRLDMSASLSIIIEQHEDALTVPYNAIQTDVDGNTYVEVYEENEMKKVFVTILMESNYYTEISSEDMKEGQLVVVISESGNSDPFEVMMQGGGF